MLSPRELRFRLLHVGELIINRNVSPILCVGEVAYTITVFVITSYRTNEGN